MKKSLLLIFPIAIGLLSTGPAAKVNQHTYDVSLDGRPIGTYHVNRTDIGEASTFRVETSTAAGLIRPVEHKFVMMSSYNDSKLISSDMKTWVNQELESSTLIQWDGSQYIKQEGESLTEICCEAVDFSSATVFFSEPTDRKAVFYEKYGKELSVEKTGSHTYEVKLPNGGIERYLYAKGEVTEVQFVQTFATITLRKQS
jgi:hypothetical protein